MIHRWPHSRHPAPAQTVHPLPHKPPGHAARLKRMQRASVRKPAKLTSVMQGGPEPIALLQSQRPCACCGKAPDRCPRVIAQLVREVCEAADRYTSASDYREEPAPVAAAAKAEGRRIGPIAGVDDEPRRATPDECGLVVGQRVRCKSTTPGDNVPSRAVGMEGTVRGARRVRVNSQSPWSTAIEVYYEGGDCRSLEHFPHDLEPAEPKAAPEVLRWAGGEECRVGDVVTLGEQSEYVVLGVGQQHDGTPRSNCVRLHCVRSRGGVTEDYVSHNTPEPLALIRRAEAAPAAGAVARFAVGQRVRIARNDASYFISGLEGCEATVTGVGKRYCDRNDAIDLVIGSGPKGLEQRGFAEDLEPLPETAERAGVRPDLGPCWLWTGILGAGAEAAASNAVARGAWPGECRAVAPCATCDLRLMTSSAATRRASGAAETRRRDRESATRGSTLRSNQSESDNHANRSCR